MSIVYPVARATPALLAPLFALAAGRADTISLQALSGMVCVVAGAYVLPMRDRHDHSLIKYATPAYLFALCAAVGTTGYSSVDDHALSVIRGISAQSSPRIPIVYLFLEALSSAWWLGLVVACRRADRRTFATIVRTRRRDVSNAALMGVGIYLTYGLVLASMEFARDVSYVVAFRQLGIPLGVLLSCTLLGERLTVPKIIGSVIMTAGVVLVGTG